MSRGKSSVFSPANQPIFEGKIISNPTRVQQQGGGYGGSGEFPFQWSWPGLVNYTATGPAIATVESKVIETIYYSMITPATITVQFFVNGVFAFEAAGISGSGAVGGGGVIPAGAFVSAFISNVGAGNGQGLWIGLTELT